MNDKIVKTFLGDKEVKEDKGDKDIWVFVSRTLFVLIKRIVFNFLYFFIFFYFLFKFPKLKYLRNLSYFIFLLSFIIYFLNHAVAVGR